MSSRRGEQRDARRAHILAAASRFFLEHGYAGTTMSAIAAELGGSKATLWSYFSSKEDLFAACMDERTEAFRRELIGMFDPAAPLRHAIEGFCARFIARINAPASLALYQLLCGESARAPEASRIFFERGPGMVEALLAGFLASHIGAGGLRDEAPLEMARSLIALCSGRAWQSMLLGASRHGPVTPTPDRIVDLFFRMYGAEA